MTDHRGATGADFAARAGRGIARVLSYQVVDELTRGSLVRLLRPFEPPPLPVQLVAPGRIHMSPKVRAFLYYAAKALGRLRVIRGAVGDREVSS